MPPPFDHHRGRVPWRRIAARAGTGAGREPGQRKRRSAREEVWNLAGVGTRCFDVLTSSHIQQPNTVFDCQPRLDAGALPGDDTGNAHAIHDPSDDAWHPGTTMSWQMANWLPTSPGRFRAIRKRTRGTEGESETDGRQRSLHRPGQGRHFCCPSSCLVRELAKPASRVLKFESSARGVTDRVLRVGSHDSRVIFQNPYCVLCGLKMAEWWARGLGCADASWAWAGVFLCSRNLTVSQKMHERSVDAQQSRNLAIGRWCCRGENTAFAL